MLEDLGKLAPLGGPKNFSKYLIATGTPLTEQHPFLVLYREQHSAEAAMVGELPWLEETIHLVEPAPH